VLRLLALIALVLLSPPLGARPLEWAPFPVLAYTPESGAIGGAYLQGVWTGDSLRHESQLAGWLTFSSKRQAELGLRPELWLATDRWVLQGELSYQNWPATWFGAGDPPQEASYTVERLKAELQVRRRLAPGCFAGCYGLQVRESFVDWDPGFPLSGDEGRDTGLGGEAVLDTRDGSIWPTRGLYVLGRAARHGDWLGNARPYTRWLLDGRAYQRAGGGVLAGQLALEGRSGEPGFRALPKLGDYLRAYEDLRFLNPWLLAGRVEWRRPLTLPAWSGRWFERRCGLVAFVELGSMAAQPEKLPGAAWKRSLGLGGRYALLPAQHVNVRADLALGSDGLALRIKVGEEF
jgi:hypothetical protein